MWQGEPSLSEDAAAGEFSARLATTSVMAASGPLPTLPPVGVHHGRPRCALCGWAVQRGSGPKAGFRERSVASLGPQCTTSKAARVGTLAIISQGVLPPVRHSSGSTGWYLAYPSCVFVRYPHARAATAHVGRATQRATHGGTQASRGYSRYCSGRGSRMSGPLGWQSHLRPG